MTNNKVGRPLVEFSEAQIEQVTKLSVIGCTEAEMAGVMAVSLATWKRLKDRDPRVNSAMDAGKGQLAVKLRRMQIEMAMAGSTPMLVHLGKTILGQGAAPAAAADKKDSPLMAFLPRADQVKGLPPKEN
tara:strand:+ start:457 stop:846 length:390 start_codon:yes stop_codon:yes gene_type:complete